MLKLLFLENKILFAEKCVKKCIAAVKKDFIAREKSQAAKSLSFPLKMNFFMELNAANVKSNFVATKIFLSNDSLVHT